MRWRPWTTRRRRSRPRWTRSGRGSSGSGRSAASTLTALAAATGISKSTLSRLETGQRRPSLELLLPLAHAYRVPLDDLVGAPGGRRPAGPAEAASGCNGRHRHPADPPARRHAGVEDRHPDVEERARAARARGLRVALRHLRPHAARARRPRPACSAPARSPSSTPGAALVRQHRRRARPRCSACSAARASGCTPGRSPDPASPLGTADRPTSRPTSATECSFATLRTNTPKDRACHVSVGTGRFCLSWTGQLSCRSFWLWRRRLPPRGRPVP